MNMKRIKKNYDIENDERIIKNREDFIKLHKLLCRYNQSEKYADVMKREKDTSSKRLLVLYKENFLEDILRTLQEENRMFGKSMSVENPYVGDLCVALARLRTQK